MKVETLYEKAIQRFGKPSQIEMLIEELAELQLALQKFKRNPTKETAEGVCDEMADVEIMLEQNRYIFNPETINKRKKFKLDRLDRTLREFGDSKYLMDGDKLEEIAGS